MSECVEREKERERQRERESGFCAFWGCRGGVVILAMMLRLLLLTAEL